MKQVKKHMNGGEQHFLQPCELADLFFGAIHKPIFLLIFKGGKIFLLYPPIIPSLTVFYMGTML